jgi:hypothetical protein
MGQYYKIIFLAEDGKYMRAFVEPWTYNSGAKLIEHAYTDDPSVMAVEYLLSPKGMFYMSRLVWAGDYAKKEESGVTLYSVASQIEEKMVRLDKKTDCRFILNHTKKLFLDKTKFKLLHPLPLLVSEGNGLGGGDYYGKNAHLCGTWARDTISLDDQPGEFSEFFPEFDDLT